MVALLTYLRSDRVVVGDCSVPGRFSLWRGSVWGSRFGMCMYFVQPAVAHVILVLYFPQTPISPYNIPVPGMIL